MSRFQLGHIGDLYGCSAPPRSRWDASDAPVSGPTVRSFFNWVSDEAAPNVGPGNTGADQDDAQMAASAPVGNQARPDAQPAADQGPAAAWWGW